MIDLDQQRDPLINSRVRDGGDFGAGRDSGRRRVLDVHKAADGDAMRQNSPRPFGLRPEAVVPGTGHLEDTGACVVARPCNIDILLRPSA
jgi:hypothetical protein